MVDLGVASSPIGVHIVQPGVLATELFELPDNDASLAATSRRCRPRQIVERGARCARLGRHRDVVPDVVRRPPAGEGRRPRRVPGGSGRVHPQRLDALGRPPRPLPEARTMTAEHPLSLLTPDEVTRPGRCWPRPGSCPTAQRWSTSSSTSRRRRSWRRWAPGDPVRPPGPRSWCRAPRWPWWSSSSRSTDRRIVDGKVIEGMRPALLFGESFSASLACKEHPDYLAALARRGITDLDHVQIDPWPAGDFGYDGRGGPAHRPVHLVPARDRRRQRLRPADRGPHRARRHRARARSSRWSTTASGTTLPSERGRRYCADDVGPLRTDLRPSRSPSPTGRASPSTATSSAGRSGRCGSRWTPTKDWCCTRSATRTKATGAPHARSCTARRSARWSCPTATRARCTAGRTRSTPASGASGA